MMHRCSSDRPSTSDVPTTSAAPRHQVHRAAVVEGLGDERFHILPHPEVGDYLKRNADDPGRWLKGMRRLKARAQ